MENLAVIGRQNILDKKGNIFAYEILYRNSPKANTAVFKDSVYATSNVLINLFTNIGIEKIVGNKIAFINVDDNILLSEFDIENIIPTDKVVLEILETTKVSSRLIEEIKHLKSIGFSFALDDFEIGQETQELVDCTDYIKLDVLNTSEEKIKATLNFIKNSNIKLLAEKVEDRKNFEKFKSLGFDYFQGYFFSKPETISLKKLTPDKLTLLNIFTELNRSIPDINKLEDLIKGNVKLSINLLKFINSANFYLRNKVTSIKHAINLIGIKGLRNWIVLFFYANEFDLKIDDNPLIDLAITRAKILEQIESKFAKNKAEEAYLVGLLSLIDVILKIPKEEIFKIVPIKDEIKRALLCKEGRYGQFLKLVENYEIKNYEKVEKILLNFNLKMEDIFTAEYNAIQYTERIKQMLSS